MLSVLVNASLRTTERTALANPAHPRSRGEHFELVHPHLNTPGSSPLTRGTRKDSVELRSAARLIPARAGNT